MFVETFLAKLHHNYDLRPRMNLSQPQNQKVVKKVQNQQKEISKPINELPNKQEPV
jgi:hypothetical protein